MYKPAKPFRDAAEGPKERDKPFSMEDHYKGEKMAKNDPVGREIYKANPYGKDIMLNWADRS